MTDKRWKDELGDEYEKQYKRPLPQDFGGGNGPSPPPPPPSPPTPPEPDL